MKLLPHHLLLFLCLSPASSDLRGSGVSVKNPAENVRGRKLGMAVSQSGTMMMMMMMGSKKRPMFVPSSSDDSGPPPPNDMCVDAINVTIGDSINGTNVGATLDGSLGRRCESRPAQGVWYSFMGNNATVAVTTCSYATFDTSIAILTGDCDTGLTCVGVSRDLCLFQSGRMVDTQDGVRYFVFVEGFRRRTGNYTLEIQEALPPPANDDCSGAIEISNGTIEVGSTFYATPENVTDCLHDDNATSTEVGVWYNFTGTGNVFHASTCLDLAPGSYVYDTYLSVYTGDCGSLQCVAANDDYCESSLRLFSSVSWETINGTVYYILVHGFGNQRGDFGLELTEEGV